jgi:hypothetical protein
MVALICALADDFKPDILPTIMKRDVNIITDLFYEILSFFYIPYILYKVKTLKPASVPFLEDKRPLGQLKHTVSKAYNIKVFDSIRKHKLNISLNDMILTVISKSINQICKDMGKPDISNFLTIIPVDSIS